MARKQLTIGLFGFGCVGNGLHEVLQISTRLHADIKTICVKDRTKTRSIPTGNFTDDPDTILEDPAINVVVELIDDAEAAYSIVAKAMRKGKAVVSANKKMIAKHLPALLALQRQYRVPFLYEAACCASIPIIRNLEEYYDNDLLESIQGIINGSTNYILTRTASENLSYAEALAQAQRLGYAERDPTLDTGGFDAKYKLVILIAHAFGVLAKPEEIYHRGIDRLGKLEIKYAHEKKYKIKLVATAYKTQHGTIAGFVLPQFVPASHKLYGVDEVYNGVVTRTCFADTQFFVGKGAGAHPTASAVLADISALSYDYRYEYKKLDPSEKLTDPRDIRLKGLLRTNREYATVLKSYFDQLHESYEDQQDAYLIGELSLQQLTAMDRLPAVPHSFVLIEPVTETIHRSRREETDLEKRKALAAVG